MENEKGSDNNMSICAKERIIALGKNQLTLTLLFKVLVNCYLPLVKEK